LAESFFLGGFQGTDDMMMLRHPFPPNVDEHCDRLVLGTMPSVKSLSDLQYYAHPRNAFWNIMGDLFGFERDETPYKERLDILRSNGIALWDVLAGCTRDGSLDSNIRNSIPNDFAGFLAQYPHITRIYFNGQAAYNFYRRSYGKLYQQKLILEVLPSTSPANAQLDYREKLKKWMVLSSK